MNLHVVRSTEDPIEISLILQLLAERMPNLLNNSLYANSIGDFLTSGGYKFIVADNYRPSKLQEEAFAFGFVTFYKLPMAERHVLSVEGFWFANDRLETQLPVWEFIASLAEKMKFQGVCVHPSGVNTPHVLNEMLTEGEVAGYPVSFQTEVLLQSLNEGVYSPFQTEPLTRGAFFADCLLINTLFEIPDFDGVRSQYDGYLYRGEGRVVNIPYWDCQDFHDLADFFFQNGILPRVSGEFSGALQAQILHQGYVEQPTVSLTDSFKIATHYATRGKREEYGLVLTVDSQRLGKHGSIFDGYATMVKHWDWFLESEFETISKTVRCLGVKKGGQFLNQLHTETQSLVNQGLGAMPSLRDATDWGKYFDEKDWAELRKVDISTDDLDSVHNAFEHYWMRAVGEIGAVDMITIGENGEITNTETKPLGLFNYQIAFQMVESRLIAAFEQQSEDHRRYPGWDLSPFGYLAKSCMDVEYFSSGMIPGNCILEAAIADKQGRTVKVLTRSSK